MAGALLACFAASTSIASAAFRPEVVVSGTGGGPALLPTGQVITATVTPGSVYQRLTTGLRADGNADADSGTSSAVSPDGRTLLVLTSGYNTGTFLLDGVTPIAFPGLDPTTGLPSGAAVQHEEFVFVYDITSGTPVRKQQIILNNAFNGIVWDPSGQRFYVSGGVDDRILVYKNTTTGFVPDAPFILLGHNTNQTLPVPKYNGSSVTNTAAGLAAPGLDLAGTVAGFDISKDGKTIVAANFHNASASIIDTGSRKVLYENVFTPPGSLNPIGEFPFWVAVKSDRGTGAYAKAYVSSERDNQVVVLSGTTVTRVIPVPAGPSKLVLSADQNRLYIACSSDDSIAVIDTKSDRLIQTISIARPGDQFKGAVPTSIAIDGHGDDREDGRESRLFVTLGGENAVAVVDLRGGNVVGRIPTGWYPTSVSRSKYGQNLFVVNEKSNAGPNPGQRDYTANIFDPTSAAAKYIFSINPTNADLYTWEVEKGGLLSLPIPGDNTLSTLSSIVDRNNNFQNRHRFAIFDYLRRRIKHVIYIVNENRTFDQVFGDLTNGSNVDPRLAYFTQPITPNMHALETNFVTLDNFYDSSETSGVGWTWVMQGHTNDYVEKTQPVDYGGPGFSYDWQGIVDNINLGLPPTGAPSIFSTRITGILDPTGSSTILPGPADPSANEGANNLAANALGGYIWESALRAGLAVRNYGWQIDLNAYSEGTLGPKLVRYPFTAGVLQSAPSTPSIQNITDKYYRAFDMNYPDIWRIEEWKREFAGHVASGTMPSLEVMTIPHDHTGSFKTALEGLNTPQLELADHDYAIGQLVEAVSHSKFWSSTAIVMLEDDPQNGGDHVEAHRSIIHIISPYTQYGSLVHHPYFSTSAVRTVEDLLGLQHLGLQDSNAEPIAAAFNTIPNTKSYKAIVPGSLCGPPVSPDLLGSACLNPTVTKTHRVADLHDGEWWAKVTEGLDFSKPDHVNPAYFNAVLQYGMTGTGQLPEKSAEAVKSQNYDADGDGK